MRPAPHQSRLNPALLRTPRTLPAIPPPGIRSQSPNPRLAPIRWTPRVWGRLANDKELVVPKLLFLALLLLLTALLERTG